MPDYDNTKPETWDAYVNSLPWMMVRRGDMEDLQREWCRLIFALSGTNESLGKHLYSGDYKSAERVLRHEITNWIHNVGYVGLNVTPKICASGLPKELWQNMDFPPLAITLFVREGFEGCSIKEIIMSFVAYPYKQSLAVARNGEYTRDCYSVAGTGLIYDDMEYFD